MNLLVTGAFKCSDEQMNKFRELGFRVFFLKDEQTALDKAGIDVSVIDAVICNGLFLYNDIKNFINLKYIQLTSAGYDRVPMSYIEEHKIEIHNARGVYSIPMAEFAIGGVLQLYKKSHFFLKNRLEHKWEKNRSLLELNGKTVCIVGCGSVGTECAKRFSAFGCRVTGIDLFPRNNENYTKILPLDKLNIVLADSDIVILTLPLTDQTRHLFDEERFSYMKENTVIVNIARGAVIKTEALEKALKEKLYGAVLDVFEEEPLLADSPLWNFENAIITPHNSFVSEKNNDRLFDVIYSNLNEWRKVNE